MTFAQFLSGQCLASGGKLVARLGKHLAGVGQLWPVFGHYLASLVLLDWQWVARFGQYCRLQIL